MKKYIKIIVGALFAFFMCCGIFTFSGCGKSGSSSNEITFQYIGNKRISMDYTYNYLIQVEVQNNTNETKYISQSNFTVTNSEVYGLYEDENIEIGSMTVRINPGQEKMVYVRIGDWGDYNYSLTYKFPDSGETYYCGSFYG